MTEKLTLKLEDMRITGEAYHAQARLAAADNFPLGKSRIKTCKNKLD